MELAGRKSKVMNIIDGQLPTSKEPSSNFLSKIEKALKGIFHDYDDL
jgi:hypothetical protein